MFSAQRGIVMRTRKLNEVTRPTYIRGVMLNHITLGVDCLYQKLYVYVKNSSRYKTV